ncbi:Na+/H+ antiporter NhaD/arsenite permease-like protein [Peribacillus deserti]|uniref:Na+/H+ antiporter NhaD/arsenite permease-like protein n=1 Tax=Peribacillus deserti TaxID=673318 RepID=A0ABS2QGA6_9BACI|nr:Na+/H+ antiporter NhaD/arsenite permease-like protein [Peribacillus deserti]
MNSETAMVLSIFLITYAIIISEKIHRTIIALNGAILMTDSVYSILWWSMSLGACLGGNGTLIGASANLILPGLAEKEGHTISFIKYLKIGFPFINISIGISTVYVYLGFLL